MLRCPTLPLCGAGCGHSPTEFARVYSVFYPEMQAIFIARIFVIRGAFPVRAGGTVGEAQDPAWPCLTSRLTPVTT